jgi:predicted ATPase
MLLRLKIKNFKNIEDDVIHFGPLTCFVGPNGAGKSNVFDAIQFLRALSEQDIQSAAQSIRSPISGSFGPKDLFLDGDTSRTIELEADLLVPRKVEDDFGRKAEPATTLLRYSIALKLVSANSPRLEIVRESLTSLKAGEAGQIIGFPHSTEFRKSVVKTTRRVGPLISTKQEAGAPSLMLHQDGGSRGRPIPAGQSPRTVVGGTNAVEYPTVLAARREMSSWQLLHLEPSVMRTPDQFGAPARITVEGAHLASTLARLVESDRRIGAALQEATNRLSELVPEVEQVAIDRDEVRQQLSVSVRMRGSRMALGPRALSDGTLRFLALVTLLLDPRACEVLCMEEPENGMHPARIPAAVKLLQDFAVDPDSAVDVENPLRQVIVNTHSPDVVRQVRADQVLFVDALDAPSGRVARVSAVEGKWRKGMPTVPLQRLFDFLGGAPLGADWKDRQLPLHFGTAQS